jgi:cytochrome P450
MKHMVDEDFPDRMPGIFLSFSAYSPSLWINDPNLLNELYVTKNKYFDKHPLVHHGLKPLLGESILLSHSNEEWSKRRKTLSAAFYKDKLVKMTDIAKDVIDFEVKRWKE